MGMLNVAVVVEEASLPTRGSAVISTGFPDSGTTRTVIDQSSETLVASMCSVTGRGRNVRRVARRGPRGRRIHRGQGNRGRFEPDAPESAAAVSSTAQRVHRTGAGNGIGNEA